MRKRVVYLTYWQRLKSCQKVKLEIKRSKTNQELHPFHAAVRETGGWSLRAGDNQHKVHFDDFPENVHEDYEMLLYAHQRMCSHLDERQASRHL